MAPSIPTRSPVLAGGRLALATALVALIGGGYLAFQAPVEAAAPAQASAPPATPASVDATIGRKICHQDEFSGRLEAVGVRSRVPGYIESIHFEPGARVDNGGTLFVIDAKPFAAELARINLGYTRIAAPISGRVGRADVTIGNLVAAGTSERIN